MLDRPLREFLVVTSLVLAPGLAGAGEQWTLTGTFETLDSHMIDVHVSTGELRLMGGRREDIEVEVRLVAEAQEGEAPRVEQLLAGATLASSYRDGWLYLEVAYPAAVDQGEIKEIWKVSVPTSFGAEVEMAVGRMAVMDLSGGVDLHLGVGDIEVAVPHGNIRASVSVGDLRVLSSTASHGQVSLYSRVGHSNLVVRGERVKGRQPAGPGSSVAVTGEGRDDIDLRANIGNVALQILEQR